MAPTVSFLQYKEIQIYNEEASFWMVLLSRRRTWTLGIVLIGAEFWLVAKNFISTHLHDGAINVCMHTLVGMETLKD